jgi:hypothetical protein
MGRVRNDLYSLILIPRYNLNSTHEHELSHQIGPNLNIYIYIKVIADRFRAILKLAHYTPSKEERLKGQILYSCCGRN